MTEQGLQQYLIKGDVPNPKGGVRGVIPSKQSYSVKKRPEKSSTGAKNDIKLDEI